MKKVVRYSTVFFLLMLLACETEPILFRGPYYVRFTESTLIQKESNSSIIDIPVHLVGPAQPDDLDISYSISGDAREGVDYIIVGSRGNLTIKDGDYTSNIRVQLLNNANNIIRSQDLILTLNNVSGGNIRVGQSEGGLGESFTLTIVDDCILGGSYSGVKSVFEIPTTGLSIVSNDCELYVLSDWDINLFDYPFPMSLTFIDNGDNTITIPQQEQPELPEDLATISGIGSVNPITREIYLVITLVDFDAPNEVRLTLTPQ